MLSTRPPHTVPRVSTGLHSRLLSGSPLSKWASQQKHMLKSAALHSGNRAAPGRGQVPGLGGWGAEAHVVLLSGVCRLAGGTRGAPRAPRQAEVQAPSSERAVLGPQLTCHGQIYYHKRGGKHLTKES